MMLYSGYETHTIEQYGCMAQGLSNRQLLKDYRLSILEVADLTAMIARGSAYYHGDNILIRYNDAKRGLRADVKELETRGYVIAKIKL